MAFSTKASRLCGAFQVSSLFDSSLIHLVHFDEFHAFEGDASRRICKGDDWNVKPSFAAFCEEQAGDLNHADFAPLAGPRPRDSDS